MFTAELYAIKLALLRLQQVREQNTFVICSDSLSALKSLQNGLLHNPLVAEVLHVYNAIRGRQLAFLWIPSHVGIHGNELADTLAKFALHRDVIVDVKLPFRDLRPLVTSYVTGLWRSDWENDSTNKLQRIGAIVDTLRPMMKPRRE